MSVLKNHPSTKRQIATTKLIQIGVWLVLAALVTILTTFGIYYYWDRYVHLGDQSPAERNIEQMEQVIREDPQDPDTRVALAEYYLSAGMSQDALALSRQVIDHYPDHGGALLIAGVAATRLDQPEAALEPLSQFISQRREHPMGQADLALEAAYYYLGESYLKLDRPQESIAALEAAVSISPTDADALYQLGLAYQATGQPEAALDKYHQAVRLVPDFTEVYGEMVISYEALGWSDHAAYARGMQAFATQDYELAQTHLEQATRALPNFAPVFFGLGMTYEAIGQLETAQIAMERALELNPDDFATRHAFGRIQLALTSQD